MSLLKFPRTRRDVQEVQAVGTGCYYREMFIFQMAKTIMSMERSVPADKAKQYLETYSMKLSSTERGVMVIKAQDKTRASQRKGALSNWKVRRLIWADNNQIRIESSVWL